MSWLKPWKKNAKPKPRKPGAMWRKARGKKRWVQTVTTVSTFPPKGIFTRKARTVARVMSSPSVSPKGIASGIRMTQYHINRMGKNLSDEQRDELRHAIRLMQHRMKRLL